MRLDLSLLGWVHTLACLVALALGTANLSLRKGTGLHRRIGRWYLGTLVLVSVTSLGIYRQHRFFFPHWLAIATLILVALAFGFARFRQPRRLWLHGHITSVVLSFYMLIGGGVNEAFLRIDVLRRLSGGFPSPMIGMTHMAVMGLTVILLIWFNVTYSETRRRRVRGHAHAVQDST